MDVRPQSRNYAIDVIKFTSCLVVLCSHSRDLVKTVPKFVETCWIGIGTPIVQLFFCISGYFMMDSFYQNNNNGSPPSPGAAALSYTLRKMKRIFPYYISAFFTHFILYSMQHVKSPSDFFKISILSIPEIFGISSVGLNHQFLNSVTWYISAMTVAIYLCSYFLYRNPDFYINLFAPLTFLLLIGYESQKNGGIIEWQMSAGILMNALLRACEGICSGAVAWLIRNYIVSLSKRNAKLLSIIEILGYSLIFAYCFLMQTIGYISLYMVLLFPILIGVTTTGVTVSFKLFNKSIFRVFGTASLLLYLNHFFIKSRLIKPYFYDMKFGYAFTIYIGGTIILSIAMYLVVSCIKKYRYKMCTALSKQR